MQARHEVGDRPERLDSYRDEQADQAEPHGKKADRRPEDGKAEEKARNQQNCAENTHRQNRNNEKMTINTITTRYHYYDWISCRNPRGWPAGDHAWGSESSNSS